MCCAATSGSAQHRMKNDFDFYHRKLQNERLLFSPSFLRLSRHICAYHMIRIRLKENRFFVVCRGMKDPSSLRTKFDKLINAISKNGVLMTTQT